MKLSDTQPKQKLAIKILIDSKEGHETFYYKDRGYNLFDFEEGFNKFTTFGTDEDPTLFDSINEAKQVAETVNNRIQWLISNVEQTFAKTGLDAKDYRMLGFVRVIPWNK